jgi:hypothetical protein
MAKSIEKKVIFIINRDTGEFILMNKYFKLDFLTNTVFWIEDDTLIPICKGYYKNGLWHFQGLGAKESQKDPFAAIFKLLFESFNY